MQLKKEGNDEKSDKGKHKFLFETLIQLILFRLKLKFLKIPFNI